MTLTFKSTWSSSTQSFLYNMDGLPSICWSLVILSRRNLQHHPWHFLAYNQAPGHQPSGSELGLTKPPLSHEPILICASPSASGEGESKFFLSQCWEVHRTNTLSCQRLVCPCPFPSCCSLIQTLLSSLSLSIYKSTDVMWWGETPSLWQRRGPLLAEGPWSSFTSSLSFEIGWPRIHCCRVCSWILDLPISTSQILGLQACIVTSGLYNARD